MSMIEGMKAEFENELAGTRKALERLTSEGMSYQPHARSWTAGTLASHLAGLPQWVRTILHTDGFDYIPAEMAPTSFATTAEVLAEFDRNVADARAALDELRPEQLSDPWTFRVLGEHRFTYHKAAVYRFFWMNHHLHHRGQFTIYLRMLDIPVPGLYGPSADEV